MIEHLPPEAATVRAVAGPAAWWGDAEHLLATIVDLLAIANWQRSDTRKTPRPDPLVRPGQQQQQRRQKLSPDEIAQRLLAKRRR